jgi:hypothetical protein
MTMIDAAIAQQEQTVLMGRRSVFSGDAAGAGTSAGGRQLRMSTVVATAEELERHRGSWEQLASDALEPNVFYEPWMLIPAADAFARRDLEFVMIYGSDIADRRSRPVLCGVFPVERARHYRGIPLTIFRLWKHDYCFLCTPLVRASVAKQCLEAFFDWLESSGAAVMEFNFVSGDGPWNRILVEVLCERNRVGVETNRFARAVLQPCAGGPSYIRGAIAGRHIKDLRRRERHLSDLGTLEYDALADGGDCDRWIDEFVELESRGWKGREGTAIGQRAGDLQFFRRVAGNAFRLGRLTILALRLDGRPVAMKCNLLAGSGAFAFKIAFDEEFAHSSPGILLEIDNIMRFHSDNLQWMDSCAAADHPMINRLWRERRIVQTTLVSTGRPAGDLFVSALPALRFLNRAARGLVSELRREEKK